MPNSWNTGGISDSKRSGLPNSSFSLKNCNIHDDVGVLKCHKGLEDDVASGDTPTEEIVAITPDVGNFAYLFGGDKCWRRNVDGVYSLRSPVFNPTRGTAIVHDAKQFGGYGFYSMEESLGKIPIDTSFVFAAKDDDFGDLEFSNFHPMIEIENDLYIGHANKIAKVSQTIADGTGTVSSTGVNVTGSGTAFNAEVATGDKIIFRAGESDEETRVVSSVTNDTALAINAGLLSAASGSSYRIEKMAFEADALTLQSDYTVESLGTDGRYLTIGTRKQKPTTSASSLAIFAGYSKIFKWDLTSNTFSIEREIKEFGISAFIEHGGSLIFNAGKNGMLYSWDGNFAQEFKRIPNSIENDTVITKNAWSSLNGITLLGVTQTAGAGGIYSLGGYDAKYPDVFNLPFSVTTPTVNVIEWAGSDLIFSYLISTTKKLQKLSTTLATAETESLILSTRDKKGQPTNVRPIVEYEIYPTNTTIQLYASVNRAAYSEITLNKAGKNVLSSREILDVREIQYKLVLTPDSSTKLLNPIVENYG